MIMWIWGIYEYLDMIPCTLIMFEFNLDGMVEWTPVEDLKSHSRFGSVEVAFDLVRFRRCACALIASKSHLDLVVEFPNIAPPNFLWFTGLLRVCPIPILNTVETREEEKMKHLRRWKGVMLFCGYLIFCCVCWVSNVCWFGVNVMTHIGRPLVFRRSWQRLTE